MTAPTTISYYIDMAPAEFQTYSGFLSAYGRVGCMEAQRSRGGLVMLDFGESRYSKPARAWGHNAWSALHNPPEGLGSWMTMDDMRHAVGAFAAGLEGCARTADFYLLALGVNNNNYEPVDMHMAGKVWGRLVRSVDNELQKRNAIHSWAIGAIDAEASFGSVADTVAWIHGYNEDTAMAPVVPLLDFGDLECSFARTPPACGSGWTLYWHWWVAWGNGHALPLPEIYGVYDRGDRLSDADKWRRLSEYRCCKPPFVFGGVIAESQVPPHYRPLYALQRLTSALSSSKHARVIPVATDITWCLLDDATGQRRHDIWCTYNGLLYAPPATDAAPFSARSADLFFHRVHRGAAISRRSSANGGRARHANHHRAS